MTKLYIANCSPQRQVVHYRLPENPKIHTQTIEIGRQVQFGNNELTDTEVNAIIAQLQIYGLIGISELARAKRGVPYIYSLNKPVPEKTFRDVIGFNQGVLTDAGKLFRQQAAVAVSNAMDSSTDDAGLTPIRALEMSVEEDASTTGEQDTKLLAEGLRVDRAQTAKPRGRKPRA